MWEAETTITGRQIVIIIVQINMTSSDVLLWLSLWHVTKHHGESQLQCTLWKWKILSDDSPSAKSHNRSCGSASLLCIPDLAREPLWTVSAMVTGLAANRKDTFPAFLRFYAVDFLASISGTDIPRCTTPWGAELPLHNPSSTETSRDVLAGQRRQNWEDEVHHTYSKLEFDVFHIENWCHIYTCHPSEQNLFSRCNATNANRKDLAWDLV